MSCKVEYNKNGQIERVLTPQGKESQLYNQLAQIPQISQQEALDAYANQLVEYKAMNTKHGKSHMFYQGDVKLGVIRTKNITETSETIDMVNVHQDYRGQGIGTELYLETIRNLMIEGKTLKSDTSQTPFAKRIWERLVEQGLATKLEGSQYESILFEGVSEETSIDDLILFNGNISLKKALEESDGQPIEVSTKGKIMFSLSSNTNPNTELGFINDLVKSGLVEERAIIEQGEKSLVVGGYSSTARLMNKQVVENFGNSTGNKVKATFDGRFKIEDLKTFRQFQGKTFQEIKQNLGEDIALIVGGIQAVYNELIFKKTNKPVFIESESKLQQQILSLLEKSGFTIQSIENYKKQFNIKNGEMPNAEALIDLANQIVAFKDGRIELDLLTEEFSHFILEALPQESLEDLLRNVHKTQEYKDNYENYREIYKGDEALIRKEMLGKVLANGLLGNSTNISQNIFERLLEALRNLFLNITPYHKQVQSLADKVSDLLVSQNLSQLEDTSGKKFRMYSSQSSGNAFIDGGKERAKRVLDYLQEMNVKLRRSNADTKTLSDNWDSIEDAQLVRAVYSILDLGTRQVRYVEEAIADAHSRGDIITQEERLVMINLKNTVLPALGGLSNSTKNLDISNEIKELSNRINRLPAEITPEITQNVINRIIASGNFPEQVKVNGNVIETRQYLEDALTEAVSDTNFVWSWFGQMSHTHDPLLNMTSLVISDMAARANAKYSDSAKNFQEKLQGTEKNLNRFSKDGWIDSLWDFKALEDDIKKNEFEVIEELLNETVTEDNYQELKTKVRETKETEFFEKLAIKNRSLYELQFTQDYYDKLDASMAGYSEATKGKLKQLFEDRRFILEKVKRDSKGRPIFSRQDKLNLEEFNRSRNQDKSPFNLTGEEKAGLIFSSIETSGSIKVANGWISKDVDPSRVSEEALIAFELNDMDNKFFLSKNYEKLSKILNTPVDSSNYESLKSNLTPAQLNDFNKSEMDGLTQEFIDGLTDADSFLSNVRLSFEDSFWSSPLEDPLKDYVDNYASLDFIEEYDKYTKLLSRRKNILKAFQDSKNATNIMGERMSKATQDDIRHLTDDIMSMRETLYREANIKIEKSTLEDNDLVESGPNMSYFGWIKDNGWEGNSYAIAEQAIKHVPTSKRSYLDSIILSLNNIKEQRVITSLDEKRMLKEYGLTLAEVRALSEDEIADLKLQAIEKRLAPYYKTFAPAGLTETLKKFDDPNANVRQIVGELQNIEGLKLTMHSSYYDLNDTRTINPNWIQGYKVSKRQPSNKYISQDFISKYKPLRDVNGNIMFDEDGVPLLPDTKENNIYQAVVAYKKEHLVNMNELGKSALYEMPQISRTKIDKIAQIIKGRKGAVNIIKEWGNEMLSFRVDEQALGQEDEAGKLLLDSGERVIPKKYLRKLETKEDLSDDLFMTLTLMGKEAQTYKARTESLSEIMALEDAFLNRKTYNGKKQDATNSYRMMKSYIDHNVFGATEIVNHQINLPIIGHVDLAKLAKVFHKYLRNKNLAYNLLIPATSWLTAEVQIKIEKMLGQYLDKDSVFLARKELMKHSQKAFTESISINKTSKLSILGQRFGQFDLDKSFENSKFNQVTRLTGKLGYIAHTAGNFTPVMTAMLSGLNGHRIKINASGEGRFVDFNVFKYEAKLEGKTDKEIKADWSALRDRSFYNYLNVDSEGQYSVDETRMLNDLGNPTTFDLQATELMIGNKIRKFVERIDGNIREEERTMLQRHFIGQYLMTHKGWLAIASAGRFKAEHLNLQTGQFEEGIYRTVGKKLTKLTKDLFDNRKDFTQFKNTFKTIWNESTPTEQTNLKRVVIEGGVLTVLYALAVALTGLADDDDQEDVWATQFATLLTERVVNETKSSQMGIFSDLSSTIQEPVVGYKNILQTLNITDLLSNEEVKKGNYAGLKDWQVYFIKNIQGVKPAYNLWTGENLKKARVSYEHFNHLEDLQPASVFLNRDTFK